MKIAVVIISDPKSGSDESLGRFFNALVVARDARAAGDQVEIVFVGPGTRWPAVASELGHPANQAYNGVRELVKGASRSCSLVFKSADSVAACGVALIAENGAGENPGGLSVHKYLANDWKVVVF